jgi:hypothetical protein
MEYCVVVDERLEDFDPEGKSFQRLGNSQTAKISFGGKSIVLTSGLAWWSYKCDVPWTGFPGSCGIWTCNHPNEHTPDHIYVRMADMDEIPVTKVLLASYSKIGAYWCVSLHYATTNQLWLQLRAPLKQTWKDFLLSSVWERFQKDVKENVSNQCLFRILLGNDILTAEDRRTMEEIFVQQIFVSVVNGASEQNEDGNQMGAAWEPAEAENGEDGKVKENTKATVNLKNVQKVKRYTATNLTEEDLKKMIF